MELRQLNYFIAISDAKSFTRAAEKLYVSQPALTGQINALENELGMKLFDRTNKFVQLTPAERSFTSTRRRCFPRLKTPSATCRPYGKTSRVRSASPFTQFSPGLPFWQFTEQSRRVFRTSGCCLTFPTHGVLTPARTGGAIAFRSFRSWLTPLQAARCWPKVPSYLPQWTTPRSPIRIRCTFYPGAAVCGAK